LNLFSARENPLSRDCLAELNSTTDAKIKIMAFIVHKLETTPMKQSVIRTAIAAGIACCAFSSMPAHAADEVVKIGFIDPLSGLMGSVGNNQLNSW
jgi:hypothetical protein